MASGRPIDPNLIAIGDFFEYNGPFPCFTQAPYNRKRNAGFALDVPFHPEFLSPELSDDLHAILSSTTAPSGSIASKAFMQPASAKEMTDVQDWFLPINGQEDNLAGLGGNWDYVKWNAMVVACFIKQLQLGPELRQLIRVHPPIQLYYEHDDSKVTNVAVMGKKEFQKVYNIKDANGPKMPSKNTPGGKPVKITKLDIRLPGDDGGSGDGGGGGDGDKGEGADTGGDGGDKGKSTDGDPKETTEGADTTEKPVDLDSGDKPDGDADADDDEYDDEDSDDDNTPDWLKLKPAPRGTKAVKHPLAGLYGDDPFLPVDSSGNWVPSGALPKRDLMTLIDPDDPLSGILTKAAQELINEAKDGKKKKKKKTKKVDKPPGEEGAGLRAATKGRRISFIPRPGSGVKRRNRPGDALILHKIGAKFGRSGLRMAGGDGGGTDAIPPEDSEKPASKTEIPWEKYHINVGGKGPDFRRRVWPSLKRDLGRKRWHIVPVACDVNGELRWWLLVIDMQVQRRWNGDKGKDGAKDSTKDGTTIGGAPDTTKTGATDTTKTGATDTTKDKGTDGTKDGGTDGSKDGGKTGAATTGPGRCIWVFNPCGAPSAPDGTVLEKFLSDVPRYIYSLASDELSKLDNHNTPVLFPRTTDFAGLTSLKGGTLPAEDYDHPGRFKRFGFKVTITGNRFNWKNRNPQTGVEIIHAMDRVLRMMEQDDARKSALWRNMGPDTEHIRCSMSTAVAPTLRDLELLQESNEAVSFQNRVRTETMVEIQRFMDWTQLRGYPFHQGTPDTIPAEGYLMLFKLHQNHKDVWRQLSQWFDQGSHAVVIGMDLTTYETTKQVVSFPLALGSMAVLHGRKGSSPADDPNQSWWKPGADAADKTGFDLLGALPDDDPGKMNPGYKYQRFHHLKEDYTGKGSMPENGGPRKPTDIITKQYPQSMVSVIIDSGGRGIIHVGNRPNGIWKVNGVEVQQSEVITRFSHVTHLYGESMHWLFLRRFATSKSENIRTQTTVKHDIQDRVRVPKKSDATVAEEYSPDDPVWMYPHHTYPDEQYKKYNFDLGNHTPHLHHHHRPKKVSSKEEKIFWEAYVNSGNTILCQNPACLKHSYHAGDGLVAAPNDTSKPCFNDMCVSSRHETYYYGSTTCTDVSRGRCLPGVDGALGTHVPGIPGNLFIDNGILLFQPEMLLSSSEGNVNTKGVIPRTSKVPPEGGEAEADQNSLPLPPLCWNRIVFTPIGRFPSTASAREYLIKNYNYEPMIFSEGEHSGVAYDMTMYERLNYYRLLMWNQVEPSQQDGWWREQEVMETAHGYFTKYDVNAWSETSFRIGYQPDVHSGLVSGARDIERPAAGKNAIEGTGDAFAWDFARGKLPDHTLPWDVDPLDEDDAHEKYGYTSAAHMLGAFVAPDPAGGEAGTRSTGSGAAVAQTNPDDMIEFLKSITVRLPFDTIEDVGKVFDRGGITNHNGGNGLKEALGDSNRGRKKGKTEGSSDTRPTSVKDITQPGVTNMRCFTRQKEGLAVPLLSTKVSQKFSRDGLGARIVTDIDNNEITIDPTDTLLPKVRRLPYPGLGMVEERYIEITRHGVPEPIIVAVKRTLIPGSGFSYPKETEGPRAEAPLQEHAEKTLDSVQEYENEGGPAAEASPRPSPKGEILAPIDSKNDATEVEETDQGTQEPHPTSSPASPTAVTEKPEEEALKPKEAAKSWPKAKAEHERITKKRKADEASSAPAAPPKKRGRKPGRKKKV
ncbi:hypothetical protein TWF481_003060 [Arthrobotrys musiformis]|uniref:Uncharacterized protein n=1 Tax=Arthrobotrys musiformis TaxID=47236 RepID=A0AAV9VR05_9PEZI